MVPAQATTYYGDDSTYAGDDGDDYGDDVASRAEMGEFDVFRAPAFTVRSPQAYYAAADDAGDDAYYYAAAGDDVRGPRPR